MKILRFIGALLVLALITTTYMTGDGPNDDGFVEEEILIQDMDSTSDLVLQPAVDNDDTLL